MDDGLAVRHCDAISAYVSRLAQVKASYPKQIGGDVMLPDLLTLAPIAPAYPQGDVRWGMIVDGTIYASTRSHKAAATKSFPTSGSEIRQPKRSKTK